MSQSVHVRNPKIDEIPLLPAALRDTGMPYLDPEWVWVVESDGHPTAFALVVCSFAHGWLVLWRVLAISPLPSTIPLNWVMEALPQVFAAAHARGCVWFLTLLGDSPVESKLARIVQSVAGGTLVPFQGALAVGKIAKKPAGKVIPFNATATLTQDSVKDIIGAFAGKVG